MFKHYVSAITLRSRTALRFLNFEWHAMRRERGDFEPEPESKWAREPAVPDTWELQTPAQKRSVRDGLPVETAHKQVEVVVKNVRRLAPANCAATIDMYTGCSWYTFKAFGMFILPQNLSTGNGQVPGWSCILSVGTRLGGVARCQSGGRGSPGHCTGAAS